MAATTENSKPKTRTTQKIVRDYFEAIERGEADAALRHYAQDALGTLHGQISGDRHVIAAHFASLHAAFPDFSLTILDLIAQGDRASVRWRLRATFAGPGSFQGFEPTGGRVDIEGVDMVWVADGAIVRVEAYTDGMTVGRALGLLPPDGSNQQRQLTRAINMRTRLLARGATGPEQIADGVWVVRGGFPTKTMNVFLVRDGDGVLAFDAGIRSMTNAVAAAAASLGGLTRVVLGHGHPDHRGVAPALGVPVFCHSAERVDAESDGGTHYFDFGKLKPLGRVALPRLLKLWDGGPVAIAGTLEEGDDVAGFRVVHLPGHAPGLIGLFRESDRLALVSDCFYTLDPETGRKGHARVPLAAFNFDTEQARASIRKLAGLAPAAAWPGHADPLVDDVAAQLERAAAST